MTLTLTTKQKYKARKLANQSRVRLGSRDVYPVDGAIRELRGKRVTVVAYESQGVIYVKDRDGKPRPISPFVLVVVADRSGETDRRTYARNAATSRRVRQMVCDARAV